MIRQLAALGVATLALAVGRNGFCQGRIVTTSGDGRIVEMDPETVQQLVPQMMNGDGSNSGVIVVHQAGDGPPTVTAIGANPVGIWAPPGTVDEDTMLKMMQEMMPIVKQVFANMQNAGVDAPATFQVTPEGTFAWTADEQDWLDKGYITQAMVDRIHALTDQMHGSMQKKLVDTTYDRIRELLNPTDEEWAVLQPRVKRVLDAQAEVAQGGQTVQRTAGMPMVGSGMGQGSIERVMSAVSQMGGPQGSNTELGKAWKALQAVMSDPRVSDAVVREKLQTWRTLHEKARDQLKLAQEDLTSVLTLRQEAVMLLVGVL